LGRDRLDGDKVWIAGRDASGEPSDGGTARVPNLQFLGPDGVPDFARDNASKCEVLLDSFFPAPPASIAPSDPSAHPVPVPDLPEISLSDIKRAIAALKPFKAPGLDGLPACIYRYRAELLADHLLPIFRASLRLSIYPKAWKQSRTVVLRKPGKPNYTVAKAY
jgi:hypothetical protein